MGGGGGGGGGRKGLKFGVPKDPGPPTIIKSTPCKKMDKVEVSDIG